MQKRALIAKQFSALHNPTRITRTVHILLNKLKIDLSNNDLTALVRVTAHQKSSHGGYYYDEIAFLPL